jgi:hypothetical protein
MHMWKGRAHSRRNVPLAEHMPTDARRCAGASRRVQATVRSRLPVFEIPLDSQRPREHRHAIHRKLLASLRQCKHSFPYAVQDARCSVQHTTSTEYSAQHTTAPFGPTRSAALPATPDRGATCKVVQHAACSMQRASCSMHATCSVHRATAPFGPVPHALCSVAPTASFPHSTLHRSGAVAAQRVGATERRLVSVARCIC